MLSLWKGVYYGEIDFIFVFVIFCGGGDLFINVYYIYCECVKWCE